MFAWLFRMLNSQTSLSHSFGRMTCIVRAIECANAFHAVLFLSLNIALHTIEHLHVYRVFKCVESEPYKRTSATEFVQLFWNVRVVKAPNFVGLAFSTEKSSSNLKTKTKNLELLRAAKAKNNRKCNFSMPKTQNKEKRQTI